MQATETTVTVLGKPGLRISSHPPTKRNPSKSHYHIITIIIKWKFTITFCFILIDNFFEWISKLYKYVYLLAVVFFFFQYSMAEDLCLRQRYERKFKSLLNLLQYCFCFMFWLFGCKAYGISAPWPGIEPIPPALEGEVLTAGPPGKSWRKVYYASNQATKTNLISILLVWELYNLILLQICTLRVLRRKGKGLGGYISWADMGSIPGSGRSPKIGHDNPLHYSCLGNPMDRGAWWVTPCVTPGVPGVTNNWAWLNSWTEIHMLWAGLDGDLSPILVPFET